MSRLIDADATKRRVADTFFDTLIPCVNRALDDSPTVDAVPVVRCRECKFGTHFGDMEDEWIRCLNLHGNPLMPFDGFCSYGERKEGVG